MLLLRFGERAAELGGMEIEAALRLWTPLYLNFEGLSRSFDPSAPLWQEFLTGMRTAGDPVAWAYSFYVAHSRDYPAGDFGCFSYHYEAETKTIRFHFFANSDRSRHSPISDTRLPQRLRELSAMFADVRRSVPEAEWVRGRSWLYNVPSYRRLFPRSTSRRRRLFRPSCSSCRCGDSSSIGTGIYGRGRQVG